MAYNRLRMNIEKTKFSSYVSEAPKLETIKIGDLVIQRTNKIRYLGVILDTVFGWKT